MANVQYWGSFGNKGTSGNDTFTIGGGGKPSAQYHNGWIDGGDGYDVFAISARKNDWSLFNNGQTQFLTTEVQGLWSKEEVTIQLNNMEEVRFMDGSFNLNGNNSSTTSGMNAGAGNSSAAQQTNVTSVNVDNSVSSTGGGSQVVTQNNSVNVDVQGNSSSVAVNDEVNSQLTDNSSSVATSDKVDNQPTDNNSMEFDFNEIFGGRKSDDLIGSVKADYLWGDKGNDSLYGNGGDDLLVGGKGIDYLEGGKGADHFGVSNKLGKGKKNYDVIVDFEVGEDAIYIDGSSKGMWIDNYQGDAILVRGKNDVIAWVEGAAGQLDWSSDGAWIM